MAVNPSIADQTLATNVPADQAKKGDISPSWKQRIPLANIKARPGGLPNDVAVYVWGGVVGTGPFIVDLDNPFSLVGYNLRAMPIWKQVLRYILLSDRCLEIRCMSEACRNTLRELFGLAVFEKATVHYPHAELQRSEISRQPQSPPHFVFVGSQFEIKGGAVLLSAWKEALPRLPEGAELSVITHLPDLYRNLADSLSGVQIYQASYGRKQLWSVFFEKCDALILPTMVESFGMVALEAMAHGMALVVTDVYALPELVDNNKNGRVVHAPISIWDGVMPSPLHYRLDQAAAIIRQMDFSAFATELADAIVDVGGNQEELLEMRKSSLALFQSRFINDGEQQ